jgi:hypothetical protein
MSRFSESDKASRCWIRWLLPFAALILTDSRVSLLSSRLA